MGDWDVLERHFGGLSAAEVSAELASLPPHDATPSSASAAAYLREHGGPDLDGESSPGDIQQRRALTASKTLSQTLSSAMTIDEAAAALGVSRSRISHRISAQSMWAFTLQGRRYVPRWQVVDRESGTGPIPGLATIVPTIPSALHPVALDAFMHTSQEDLGGQSPLEWLISGGNPQLVADWLTGMAHG